jgi:hypothetical protein
MGKNTSKIDSLRDSNFNSDESDVESGFKFLDEKSNWRNNQDKHTSIMNKIDSDKIKK